MISVMMCDDHLSALDAILGELGKDEKYTISGRAASGEECIQLIDNGLIPDILILDISMPNGIPRAREWRLGFSRHPCSCHRPVPEPRRRSPSLGLYYLVPGRHARASPRSA